MALITAALAVYFFSLQCLALLEEPLVSFDAVNPASHLTITNSPILVSQDDFAGVHIAANSLASDLQQITGISRAIKPWTTANITQDAVLPSAIIAGSANSSLFRHFSSEGIIDLSDIEGKWESFKTTVVNKPLPGVEQALVIAGSDKRGTIFGIHTLAEQCGQSPYVPSLILCNT